MIRALLNAGVDCGAVGKRRETALNLFLSYCHDEGRKVGNEPFNLSHGRMNLNSTEPPGRGLSFFRALGTNHPTPKIYRVFFSNSSPNLRNGLQAKQVLRALIPGSDLEQKNSANQTPSELANFVGKEELAAIIDDHLSRMDRAPITEKDLFGHGI